MSTPSEERICKRCDKKFRAELKNKYRYCPACRKWINDVGGQPFAGGIKIGRHDG